jgi:hypothetical protein
MTLLSTALPTFGWGELFLPQVTAFRYYASPQNKWDTLVLPQIEKSRIPLLPSEENGAIKFMFEGLPSDKRVPGDIPWGDWVKPMAWWFAFFGPFFFLMFGLCVILRRQWMDRERLVFPLVQVPLAMIQAEDRRERVNAFFKNRMMWFGFAVPVLLDAYNSLNLYWPFFPPMERAWTVRDIFGFHKIQFILNWPLMGFTYLINLDIGFSLWFFGWLKQFVADLVTWLGWTLGERDFYSAESPSVSHFCMGAILAMVAIQLWMARRHLADVFRKAFVSAADVDDRGETVSYRTALIGSLVCFVWIIVWLSLTGMAWWVALLVVVLAFAIFLGITRLAIEGGVPVAQTPFIPQSFIPRLIGTSVLGDQGIVMMGMCFAWISDLRVFLLPFFAHSVRLADSVNMRRRPLSWVMMLTVVVALLVTVVTIFMLSYANGGINLNQWFFVGGAQWPGRYAAKFITEPVTAENGQFGVKWTITAGGGVFMAFLMFMRQRFLWWPLHPLGLPFNIPDWGWTSIFYAWVIKSVALKYGGVRLYQRLKPTFLGLILGQFTSAGFWFLMDIATNIRSGHVLYNM